MGSRKLSIDMLKGVLALLVMAGHLAEVIHQRHLLLWVGSGFRMALMVGLSGYLLNMARLRSETISVLLVRYGRRFFLPWAVAMLFYLMLSGYPIGPSLPVDLLLRPPFHLWYIPALLLLIFSVRVIPWPVERLLLVGAIISLVVIFTYPIEHGLIGWGLFAIDSRLLRFAFHFALGMMVAQQVVTPRSWRGMALIVATLTAMMSWVQLYGEAESLRHVVARIAMNGGLICLIPVILARMPIWTPICFIGRESLFFYLWHPLFIALALHAPLSNWLLLPVAALAMMAICIGLGGTGTIGTLFGTARRRPVVVPESALAPVPTA